MPLPLGHAAIGLLTCEGCSKETVRLGRLKVLAFVAILANLPDFDVIYGLIVRLDGNAFHRGPTHSLFFALLMGFIASGMWRVSDLFPKISFHTAFAVIFSHTVADLLLTDSGVSLLWPLQVHWATGHADLHAVLSAVLFGNYQYAGLILTCLVLMLLIRVAKHRNEDRRGRSLARFQGGAVLPPAFQAPYQGSEGE